MYVHCMCINVNRKDVEKLKIYVLRKNETATMFILKKPSLVVNYTLCDTAKKM